MTEAKLFLFDCVFTIHCTPAAFSTQYRGSSSKYLSSIWLTKSQLLQSSTYRVLVKGRYIQISV